MSHFERENLALSIRQARMLFARNAKPEWARAPGEFPEPATDEEVVLRYRDAQQAVLDINLIYGEEQHWEDALELMRELIASNDPFWFGRGSDIPRNARIARPDWELPPDLVTRIEEVLRSEKRFEMLDVALSACRELEIDSPDVLRLFREGVEGLTRVERYKLARTSFLRLVEGLGYPYVQDRIDADRLEPTHEAYDRMDEAVGGIDDPQERKRLLAECADRQEEELKRLSRHERAERARLSDDAGLGQAAARDVLGAIVSEPDHSMFGGFDLSDRDFRGVSNFTGVNVVGRRLHRVNLCESRKLLNAFIDEADFTGANLRQARLSDARKAIFREADLSGAELGHSNLQECDFSGANLLGADLCGAKLLGADFRGANLRAANLAEAKLKGAHFDGVDLREVLGLEQNQLRGTHCDEQTRLPEGLQPPRAPRASRAKPRIAYYVPEVSLGHCEPNAHDFFEGKVSWPPQGYEGAAADAQLALSIEHALADATESSDTDSSFFAIVRPPGGRKRKRAPYLPDSVDRGDRWQDLWSDGEYACRQKGSSLLRKKLLDAGRFTVKLEGEVSSLDFYVGTSSSGAEVGVFVYLVET